MHFFLISSIVISSLPTSIVDRLDSGHGKMKGNFSVSELTQIMDDPFVFQNELIYSKFSHHYLRQYTKDVDAYLCKRGIRRQENRIFLVFELFVKSIKGIKCIVEDEIQRAKKAEIKMSKPRGAEKLISKQ